MANQNKIEITLSMYARPRSEEEQNALQDLIDEIKDQRGMDVIMSPQMEYRSAEWADAMRSIEVFVGSNAYSIVRPVIDEVIRQIVARVARGPASGQVIHQTVNYYNYGNINIYNTVYNLRDGTADDEDDQAK